VETALREADEQFLARTADRLRARGMPVTTKRVEGGPAAVIAREAETGNYDLIMMGRRGPGLEDETAEFLGSVTERVLRRVACPVLVVKLPSPS
jgi:nucleotide-binding universal stress UspA family protein